MQPTDELKNQLFSGHIDRVKEFFFDHVVDQTSILPIVLSKGPTGVPFLFNYANRENPQLVITHLVRYQIPSILFAIFNA